MTSYVKALIDGMEIPIKVGGYTGATETASSDKDIQQAYMAWIPKHLKKKLSGRKSLSVVLPSGERKSVPIKKLGNWSRGSGAIWFEGKPFKHLSLFTLHKMNSEAKNLIADSEYTLLRHLRKPRSTREPTVYGMSGQLVNPELARKRKGRTKMSHVKIVHGRREIWIPRTKNPTHRGNKRLHRKKDFRKAHWRIIGEA